MLIILRTIEVYGEDQAKEVIRSNALLAD